MSKGAGLNLQDTVGQSILKDGFFIASRGLQDIDVSGVLKDDITWPEVEEVYPYKFPSFVQKAVDQLWNAASRIEVTHRVVIVKVKNLSRERAVMYIRKQDYPLPKNAVIGIECKLTTRSKGSRLRINKPVLWGDYVAVPLGSLDCDLMSASKSDDTLRIESLKNV